MINRHRLYSAELFENFCYERGVNTTVQELEEFHKLGLLYPDVISEPDNSASVITENEDLRSLWNNRPEHVPYEQWSDLDEKGKIVWYHSACIYPLSALKACAKTTIPLQYYETFASTENRRIVEIAKGISTDLSKSLEPYRDAVPAWRRIVELLECAERVLDEYKESVVKDSGELRREDVSQEQWLDFVSTVRYTFKECAKRVFVGELKLSPIELFNYQEMLNQRLLSLMGDFERQALLTFIPPSLWYRSHGPFRFGLTILRDLEIINAIGHFCFKCKTSTPLKYCIKCGQVMPPVKRGRPRMTCSEECAKDLKSQQQQVRRTQNHSSSSP